MSKDAVKILSVRIIAAVALLGLANQSAAKPLRRFRVGLVFDLSGHRDAAENVVRGIEYAASILKGDGIDLVLEKHNSKSDALGTRTAMLEVLKDPPDMIIAEVDSSKALIAADMSEQAHRVMITPFATSPAVTNGKKYVFRACFQDNFQGSKLADFAMRDLHANTAAIVTDAGSLYSKTLGAAFKKRYQELGGNIVAEQTLLDSTPSLDALVNSVLVKRPKLVFMPVYEPVAARILSEVSARNLANTAFIGGDGWGASGPFRDLIFSKQKSLSAYWVTHFKGDLDRDHTDPLARDFTKKTGTQFLSSAAIGYDAAMLAGRALAAIGHAPDQEKLKDQMHAMHAYHGVTGDIFFGPNQDPQKSLWIGKVGPGQIDMIKELKP